MAKIALLIGVSKYPSGDLNPLRNAINDAKAIQRILNHPEMGAFDEVKLLENPEKIAMEMAIEALLPFNRKLDDLLLFYFSGHGIRDIEGKLYLAAHNTQEQYLMSTAVSSSFIHNLMNNCRSRRQVIILDCCFSAAFTEGLTAKDAGTIDIKQQLGGEGRAILTSSTATQYSFEQETDELSIYTHYLIEGIETGAADQNQDGKLSVDELHQYAKEKVQENKPQMKPEIFAIGEGYNIFLAKNPKIIPRKEKTQIDIIKLLQKQGFESNKIEAVKDILGEDQKKPQKIQQELPEIVPDSQNNEKDLKPNNTFHDELKDESRNEMETNLADKLEQEALMDDVRWINELSLKIRLSAAFVVLLLMTILFFFQPFEKASKDEFEEELFLESEELSETALGQTDSSKSVRIMTAAGFGLRYMPNYSRQNNVVKSIPIGTIIYPLETIYKYGENWYRIKTSDGKKGWVPDKYSMPIDLNEKGLAYIEVANRKINNVQGNHFGAYVELCHFLNRVSHSPEITEPNIIAELKLLYLIALQTSLNKIPLAQKDKYPYSNWLSDQQTNIDNSTGNWLVKGERFEQLYEEYSHLPIAARILREANIR